MGTPVVTDNGSLGGLTAIVVVEAVVETAAAAATMVEEDRMGIVAAEADMAGADGGQTNWKCAVRSSA